MVAETRVPLACTAEALKEEGVLDRIVEHMGNEIWKNEGNVALALLSTISLKVKNIRPIHFVFCGKSAGGKSHVWERVMNLYDNLETIKKKNPETEEVYFENKGTKILRTYISAKALNYYAKDNPTFTFDGKIIGLRDMHGDDATKDTLKVLMSEEGLYSDIVGNMRGERGKYLETLSVPGKPLITGTTADDDILEEFSNRGLVLVPDTSEKMTRDILLFTGVRESIPQYRKTISGAVKDIVKHLPEKEVEVPFALPLAMTFPNYIRNRRDMPNVLNLFKCSALLHYRNRQEVTLTDGRTVLLANSKDYEAIRRYSKELTAYTLTMEGGIGGNTWETYKLMQEIAKKKLDNGGNGLFPEEELSRVEIDPNDLINANLFCKTTIYEHLEKLVDAQKIKAKVTRAVETYGDIEKEGRNKYTYFLVPQLTPENIFPPWEELIKRTDEALEKAVSEKMIGKKEEFPWMLGDDKEYTLREEHMMKEVV